MLFLILQLHHINELPSTTTLIESTDSQNIFTLIRLLLPS